MTLEEAERAVEALVFASPEPISIKDLAQYLDLSLGAVEHLIEKIDQAYAQRAVMLRKTAGGYQFVTRPQWAKIVEKLDRPVISAPLSPAALETLAIVAYRQPVTRHDIEKIRGVRSDSAVNSLLERELIEEVGRREGPGRPILYGVTKKFLTAFDLNSVRDLPKFTEREVAVAVEE